MLENLLPSRSASRNHLVHKLLEFELSPDRRQIFGLDETPIAAEEVEATLSFLLELDKPIAELGSDDLSRLHGLICPDEPQPFRTTPAPKLSPTHEPVDPRIIPGAIERFFEWVQSPSFSEMHAVQQMTVSQMRLTEIHPFRALSGVTVSLFSYYFLLANGYLLPLYEEGENAAFREALEQAFAFSTEALVRLHGQACERAYDYVLRKEKGESV